MSQGCHGPVACAAGQRATAPASRSRARRRPQVRWSTGTALWPAAPVRAATSSAAGSARRRSDRRQRPTPAGCRDRCPAGRPWPPRRRRRGARSAATSETSRMARSRTPVSSARCSTTLCHAGALIAGRQSVNRQSIDLSVSLLNDCVAMAHDGFRPKPQPPRPPPHTGRQASATRPRRRACRDSGRRPAPSRSRGASARCAR